MVFCNISAHRTVYTSEGRSVLSSLPVQHLVQENHPASDLCIQKERMDNMETAFKAHHPILLNSVFLKAQIIVADFVSAKILSFGKTSAQRASINERAEKYMKQYGNLILRFAYSYVHNKADAEEVLQETLIKVLDADPVFENETHEKAYILRAASNIAKNRIISNRRHESDELNEELAAEEREDLSFVWEAVKSLPEVQREVIHLFYQEGLQTVEISEVLGRNESTIRSDLRRARESLKRILKEEYDFG